MSVVTEGKYMEHIAKFQVQYSRTQPKPLVDYLHPGTMVYPNCETYSSIVPFKYMFVEKMAGDFALTNMPYYCHRCKRFIWLYNTDVHYENNHPKDFDTDGG